jgi:iron complex outermembrane receptor protein
VGYVVGAPYNSEADKLALGEIKGTGTLFSLPGGDVKAAIGASYSSENFLFDQITTSSTLVFQRHVGSAFGEINIPVVSEANSVPLTRRLIVSAAARYDHYSDFGGTTNPKVGILWQPFSDLDLRSSYGTSFRAPDAAQAYHKLGAPNAGEFIFGFKFTAPNAIGTVPTFLLIGTDPNLGPERSRTFNVGFDFRPALLNGGKLSLDYYDVHFADRISTPPLDVNALTKPQVYGSLITPLANDAASAAYLASAIASGRTFIGAGSAGVRYVYDFQTRNEAAVYQSGFDIAANYPFSIGRDSFDTHLNAAIIDHIDTALAPGARFTDTVNTYSNPLHLRLRADVTWTRRAWSGTTAVNYANSYDDTSANPVGHIGASTTVDLNLRYRPGTNSGLLKGVLIEAAVLNLFNSSPPYAHGANVTFPGAHYDVGNGDVLGRFISLSIAKQW